MKLRVPALALFVLPAGLLVAAGPSGHTGGQSGGAAPKLHVSGNKLVNVDGKTVALHGMDRVGIEFWCVRARGSSRARAAKRPSRT